MPPISYARHRFPPAVIQHAVWTYLRFTLSYRDVEDLLAERGLDVSYETVRRWVLKFGPAVAQRLRHCRPRPSGCWHLDEMVARIAGETVYLWRAVDHEGEVLDIVVQRGRDKAAALKLMRKLLKKQGFAPTVEGHACTRDRAEGRMAPGPRCRMHRDCDFVGFHRERVRIFSPNRSA